MKQYKISYTYAGKEKTFLNKAGDAIGAESSFIKWTKLARLQDVKVKECKEITV